MSPFTPPPEARSWVAGADESWFPIQNLPLGLALLPDGTRSLILRIGEFGLSLKMLRAEGLVPQTRDQSNSAASLSVEDFRELRRSAYSLLERSNPILRDHPARDVILLPLEALRLELPCQIPNFTDFYSGIYHASNVGKMFRPDMPPLLPNYRHLPVAYNGRASSVRISGTPVVRPKGQVKDPEGAEPVFIPTRELDFEIELGFYGARHEGPSSEVGIEDAESHILGVCLVNDWSARDVQRWEYQPLGPFLAKSFMTSVSPWIVSLDALESFRIAGEEQTPEPPPHLRAHQPHHFDIVIEGWLSTSRTSEPQLISRTNGKFLYWSFAQQLAHLTSNGLECLPGELCASGTISGDTPESLGSLLEMSWRGTRPITLSETGERRTYLEDGDLFSMRAYGFRDGYRIGLGEVSGKVLKAT